MSKPEKDFSLETFLPYRLVRIAEQVSQEFSRNYREKYGLSRPEWRCLATLGQCEKLTAKEIGELSTMHKTKVSRAVAELERRGWLTRRTDLEDRRAEHLSLTAAGRRAYAAMVPVAGDFERALQADLGGKAVSELLEGLAALEERYDLGGAPGSGSAT
jgi:DNA-binding MarR family transcriptional regulator